MGYLFNKNTGDFSSFGNAILDTSLNCLRNIFCEARIRQHANNVFWDNFCLVSILALFEFVAVKLLFDLHILVWYSLASVVTFLLYYIDKTDERVPRYALHFMEFNGGWPGALVAQKLLRHEIREPGHQFRLEILMKLNVFLLIACAIFYNWECLIDYIEVLIHNIIGIVEASEPYLQRIDNVVYLFRFLLRYINILADLCEFLWRILH
ncbi:hypothetical protein DdX_10643 [Ditylenchus destructor]|uniref:Uncharacterized protein n=1 Tax=Ditylenchus destructor TaxID=166010 RepID=A0AAD4QZ23_9BILA|nr:hypothetical protein DdX_10643 [Ditylenchus destructor]